MLEEVRNSDLIPTLYGGNASADSLFTLDVDSNAQIDHVIARFSETMEGISIPAEDIQVSGYTVQSAKTAEDLSGITFSGSFGNGSDGEYLVIVINESGSPDVNAEPMVVIPSNHISDMTGNYFAGVTDQAQPQQQD